MAIENGVQNAELGYILDPAFQIENINGKPAVGGHIEIFEAGTDNKYISYQNFDGAQNPFKIPLGADGRAVILGDPSLSYDVYAYDSYNNLMFSRLNVQCNVPGTINLSGADTRINNTDGTLDISLRTLGNNVRQYTINTHNKVLDVQSPLYFVENSETATVIGFSGDDYASKEYVDSAVSSKLDTTAFSNVSGDFLTDKFEYDDDNHITAYNHSAFAGGGGSGPNYEAGDHIDITDNVISVTGLPDSADLENAVNSAVEEVENKFEYNINNYITAYNNSAFAGKEYSAGDGISIVNNVISVTSQGGGIEQVSHDNTLSGNGNSIPLGIANIEDFVKQDDLTGYQPAGDYYSASNPSGFITNDAITGLQPSGDYATHNDLTAYATTAQVADKLDTTAFSTVSGDFLTAHQDISNLMPKSESANFYPMTGNPSGFLTAHQDLSDYATTAELADKLDTTAFSTVSGNFLTAHQSLDGYLTKTSADTLYQPKGDYANATALDSKVDTSSFSSFSSTTNEHIEYLSATLSGSYELSAGNGIDITDYPAQQKTVISVTAQGGDSEVDQVVREYSAAGTWLTAHQDLSNYQTTAGMTAYQPVGDYYSASNPSGFLTAVPVGTMNESNFGYDASDKITAYNGSAFKAGDEFPQSATEAIETVTANSAYWNGTTETVSSNSGAWGGSALPISAGPGIKFEMVNDTLVASTDETVLFETTSPSGVSAVTCSETVKNFEKIAVLPSRFASNLGGGTGPYQYYETKWLTTGADTVNTIEPMIFEYLFWKIAKYSANNDFTQFVWNGGFEVQQDTHTYTNLSTCNVGIKKIVGIKRIAGGN